MRSKLRVGITLALLAASAAHADITASRQTAASKSARAGEAEFRELYRELIETNTTLSSGSCTDASNAMKARLSAAGYPESQLHVIVPRGRPKDGNLVALLPGTDPKLKPILLLAHIDVVEAKAEDWERDPFKLTEENGFFYARGASDDKAMAAIFTDSMVRWGKQSYKPRRGIKLALTCGEETPNVFNGVQYLVKEHRELIDAAFALNEGGGGRYEASTGKYQYNGVQAGEKLYQDFTLEVTNPGGHSSRPTPDNAIGQMSRALERIVEFQFAVEFNDTTRGYFRQYGAIVGGEMGKAMQAAANGDMDAVQRVQQDPGFNGTLRTTCVPTMVDGGHAPNALPQNVKANINCRIFPGHAPEEIRQRLIHVINDAGVKVSFQAPPEQASPPPPLTAEILGPIEKLTAEMFPGVPVLPAQASGGTDGRFMTPAGIPTYGVSGIFSDGATTNAHGLNERIRVQSLMEGREFLHRLVQMYAGGK